MTGTSSTDGQPFDFNKFLVELDNGDMEDNDYLDEEDIEEATQWAVSGENYYASPTVCARIPPGVYKIDYHPSMGPHFERVALKSEKLLRFSDHTTDRVISEIRDFWERKPVFDHYKITFKRGIFMYGPPGTGKSCTVQQVMEDVVRQGGIAVPGWPGADLFVAAMKLLRKIEPEIPVVIVMEDLDSILRNENESKMLNVLDGVEKIDNVVYLATTNYIESFEPRIINRPSRFDRKIEVGFPPAPVRLRYLQSLASRGQDLNLDLDKWVEDTADFSIAHLKELFITTVILGNSYEDSLKELRSHESLGTTEEDE